MPLRRLGAWSAACLALASWACPTATSRRACEYQIPDGYVGWVRVDFGVADASPLPIVNDRYLFRFPADGRLRTSSQMEVGWARDLHFYVSGTSLKPIESTGWGEGGMIWAGFNGGTQGETTSYQFFFVGTETQYRANVESPEANQPFHAGQGPEANLPKTGSLVPLRTN